MTEPAVSARAPISTPAGEFRVGHVLSSAFSVLLRNLPQFGALSVIATLPYGILLITGGTTARSLTDEQPFGSSGYFLQALLEIVLTAFCESIVVFGAFQAIRARPFRVSESLGKGLVRFFPVLGTSVLYSIVTGFAALLLVVPALIVMTMFYVASPVCVVERLGPFQSLSRSGDLTKGYRWQIFGLSFLLGLGMVVASLVVGAVLGLIAVPMILTVGIFIWESLSRALLALVAVVAYHDLRVAKEGVDIDHIASVFD